MNCVWYSDPVKVEIKDSIKDMIHDLMIHDLRHEDFQPTNISYYDKLEIVINTK